VRNLIRIAVDMPIEPLRAAIDARPDLWGEITARQDHPMSPHRDTEAVFLRWCRGADVVSVFTDLVAVDYPALHVLHRETWPILDAIVNAVGGTELGRAMVVNLKPGGFIKPHADEGAYADTFERFHVPLRAPGECYFHVDGDGETETVRMKTGELWWFDHKRTHWVGNASVDPRWHLIVDIKAPAYRRERVMQAASMEPST
jgi:hypothetical protein